MVPLASGDLTVAGFKLGGLGEPVAGGDAQAVQDRGLCVGDVAPFAGAQAASGVVHQTQIIHQAEQYAPLRGVGFVALEVQQGFEGQVELVEEALLGLGLDGVPKVKTRCQAFLDTGVF